MSREYVLQPFRAGIDLKIDYARELNEQQHAAVTAAPGPSLVIAGAGSGKTRTLTYRVAYLIEHGVQPERILLLTFTNKAAREMMRRVNDLLGADMSSLWGGTFHSIGNRVLRRHGERLGYRPDYTIFDREDSKDLVQACVDAEKIDVTESRFPKADVLADIFSTALNRHQTIKETLELEYPHFAALATAITHLQSKYQERKRANNAVDFDDLLALWLKLLESDPDVREQYQARFQFVLVDEYQDTNKLQSDLIDLLSARHRNLMVVGDDSQSIYSWRGANFRNILEFSRRFPDASIYKIETNYRSTPEILAVANAAISNNIGQYKKELVSACKAGEKPALVACPSGAEQAAFVAQRILQLRDEGINMNEIAVLYRSHFHCLEVQLELTRRGIPFSLTSGVRFFEQAHIKDVTAFIKFLTNPGDELAFKRIVRMLPGIGGKGADKLWGAFAQARQHGNGGEPSIAKDLQRSASAIPKKAAVGWAQLLATLAQAETPDMRTNPSKIISHVVEAIYEEYAEDNFADYRKRIDELQQLEDFALTFVDTSEFLTQLALLSNLEAEEDKPRPGDDEMVKLTTVHQAKGLEFTAVFVIMLCEGLFPSSRSVESIDSLEEERRLFYVAVTRARKELYLSYPLMRFSHGYSGDIMQQRSRFLQEIPPGLLEEWSLRVSGGPF